VSTLFEIRTTAPPPIDVVQHGADVDLVVARPALPATGPWPDGTIRLHLPRSSTRSTDITWKAGAVTVRVFSLASASDWILALRLVENVARWAGAGIAAESFGDMTADELGQRIPDDTWREQARSGVRAVTALVSDGRGPIEIPGPVRSFHVGSRTLETLRGRDDDETVSRWVAAMLRVQYFGLDDATEHFAGVFQAHRREGGEPFQFAIWTPNRACALPAVPLIAISGDDQQDRDVIFIPADAVDSLADGRWAWLDEKQRVVFGFDEAHWPELRRNARRFTTKP
jgi:hypothetical protein